MDKCGHAECDAHSIWTGASEYKGKGKTFRDIYMQIIALDFNEVREVQ